MVLAVAGCATKDTAKSSAAVATTQAAAATTQAAAATTQAAAATTAATTSAATTTQATTTSAAASDTGTIPLSQLGKQDGKEFTITYLSPSTASEYWQYNEIGMKNAIADLQSQCGIKVNFSTTGAAEESQSDAYVKAFESTIASKPDAIITATLAAEATVPKTQEAKDAGIYVNFVGMGLEGGDSNQYGDLYGVHYYCDNTVIGETAAQAMLDQMKKKGIEPKGIVGIHMSVIVDTLEARMDGFKAYMKKNAPDLQCLDTLYNQNQLENAQSNVETQISTYGDKLVGLYGANNISGDGIALGIAGANLSDKVVGIGVDSDSTEIDALKAGNLDVIVAQTPYEQGYNAMVNAVEYLVTGKNYATEKHINCPSQAVTKDNMTEDKFAALLDPTLLEKK